MDSLIINENDIEEEYTIYWDKPLGIGINGKVFECADSCSRRCAVKILPDCEEARREASIQWECGDCEEIVQIFDVYSNLVGEENKPYLYIVMELVDGGELFDYLYSKRVSEEEAKKLMKQIIKALDHLHSLNVAHRDIKPENILIKKKYGKNVLRLADFGYAETDDIKFNDPFYTFYYAAPEVLVHDPCFNELGQEGATLYDKKCDLWSLGVVAYIMLMGYPPFSSKSKKAEMTADMYQSIITGSFFYQESDWDKYSDEAHDFVFSLLKLNPEDRLSTKELLQHPWINPLDSYQRLYW